ncbi:hypothetical protein [Sphingomonas sp.]|uniref:hypothetical protein n=1 Tax=Sphingomonas sp. TaxID=28214 RepID=UPI002DB90926|nr:hypothetical protein [Sphingomonas sp.]HEU4968558.1 hypothetical protein [Sphingomonas sp.]
MAAIRSMLITASLLATAAAAQTASETIDVIGRSPEEVRQEAQQFVRATGVGDDGRAIARWVEPVCPHVLGVSADIGKRVADTVRAVASEAGIRVARTPCRTNIVISFVGDGGALVRKVAEKAPGRLTDVPAEDRAALLRGDAPIRWWHATEMRTKDGLGTTGNEAPPFAKLDGPGGVPMAGEVHFQYNSSIASTQMVRVLKAATVVIDVNRATGMPLDSVAAFAAMVSLAEVGPSEQPPAKSILSLFSEDGPRDLTPLDENFLRALYRLPLDRTALAQRGLLVRGLLNPAKRDEN